MSQIPRSVIDRIGKMYKDKNRMATSMATLQDIWLMRPPIRKEAGQRLLELTRAVDKTMRARAIISAKQSSGQSVAVEAAVLAFARDSLDVLKGDPPLLSPVLVRRLPLRTPPVPPTRRGSRRRSRKAQRRWPTPTKRPPPRRTWRRPIQGRRRRAALRRAAVFPLHQGA
ncbi:hypothetical protein ACQY0O_005970 [Thecaphora frezii]